VVIAGALHQDHHGMLGNSGAHVRTLRPSDQASFCCLPAASSVSCTHAWLCSISTGSSRNHGVWCSIIDSSGRSRQGQRVRCKESSPCPNAYPIFERPSREESALAMCLLHGVIWRSYRTPSSSTSRPSVWSVSQQASALRLSPEGRWTNHGLWLLKCGASTWLGRSPRVAATQASPHSTNL